ncbi:MAG: hypothetical protein KQH53_15480 [Desulfarculaceae bacterium]|nr:hypothetical protein [Desulfarculaceae bacterium]
MSSAALTPEILRALLDRERLLLAGRLLPGVVHNLSGGVQTMSLPLDLARLALGRGDSQKLADKLETMREGLERMTMEVGLLARRSRTDRKLASEPLDLAELAGGELDFWRSDLFMKHEVRLERELQGDLPLARCAPADAALALNLVLANAVEAVQGGPSPVIVVSALAVENGLALEVSDTGPGPEAELAKSMFEPFTGDKGEGHDGLGLFLAREALRPWCGEVAWLPEAGRTTFRISLPRA